MNAGCGRVTTLYASLFGSAVALLLCFAAATARGDAPRPEAAGAAAPHPARSVTRDRGRLGSAGNPIPLAGTETSAAKRLASAPGRAVTLRFGSLVATIYGLPRVVLPAGAGAGGPALGDARGAIEWRDDSWAHESDVYSGAGLRLALVPAWALDIEDDRVLRRDSADPLEWARAHADYWTTAVGVEFRF